MAAFPRPKQAFVEEDLESNLGSWWKLLPLFPFFCFFFAPSLPPLNLSEFCRFLDPCRIDGIQAVDPAGVVSTGAELRKYEAGWGVSSRVQLSEGMGVLFAIAKAEIIEVCEEGGEQI